MDPEWVEGYKNADYKAFDLKKLPERWRGRELAMMGSLGILFDNTPQDKICKVVLEENIYENWKHGRTVLIGDGTFPFYFPSCALLLLIHMTYSNIFLP
jgi:hypothetical protein